VLFGVVAEMGVAGVERPRMKEDIRRVIEEEEEEDDDDGASTGTAMLVAAETVAV